jgi:hypothetical protein
MAFENETLAFIDKWLSERYTETAEPLIGGGASDFADYKERVGYIHCIKDLNDALKGFVEKINNGLRSGKT